MYLVAVAWVYVVLMMSVVEASGTGTVLGAVFTFLLYGVLPLAIVMYLMGTPARRRARRAAHRRRLQSSAARCTRRATSEPATARTRPPRTAFARSLRARPRRDHANRHAQRRHRRARRTAPAGNPRPVPCKQYRARS